MQVVGAAQALAFGGGARVSVPDLPVEGDRVGPPARVVVPDPFPPGVAVEWARYCESLVTIVILGRAGPWCDADRCAPMGRLKICAFSGTGEVPGGYR